MGYPRLVTKFFTPKIVWYQTDVTVIVRILLQDVDNYFLRVECDYLLFSTTVNEKDYYLCLYLFGTVVADKTTHVNVGREIKITLIKAHKWTEWLRLHIEKEKNHSIVSDPDHLYKNTWSVTPFSFAERESFTEYKRKNNITQIMPDVPSTDEEESDDEMMNHIFW